MCFSFEILSTFVFVLFASKAITTQISINLHDYSQLNVGFLSVYQHGPYFEDLKSREKPTGNLPV
jgi:hypothetical protein